MSPAGTDLNNAGKAVNKTPVTPLVELIVEETRIGRW